MDLSLGISIDANYVCTYLESMEFKRSIIVLVFLSCLISLKQALIWIVWWKIDAYYVYITSG